MRLKLADALSSLGQLGDPRRQPPVGLLEQRPQPLFEPALVDGAVQTGELLDPGALALPTSGDGDTQSGLPFWRVGEVLRKLSDWVLLVPVRRVGRLLLRSRLCQRWGRRRRRQVLRSGPRAQRLLSEPRELP